jgi:hypothetical protein
VAAAVPDGGADDEQRRAGDDVQEIGLVGGRRADVDDDPGGREVGGVLAAQEVVERALAEVRIDGAGVQGGRQEAVRHVVRLAVEAAQPLELDDVGRAVEGQLDGHRSRGRDDPLGEHLRAHLGALLAHHRAEPGDAVDEALAVLVPDGRPGHVGPAALLADEVTVGDEAVDGAPKGDAADAVLGAEDGFGREDGVLGQRGDAAPEVLADREVLRSGDRADHGPKVRDRKTSGRHVV